MRKTLLLFSAVFIFLFYSFINFTEPSGQSYAPQTYGGGPFLIGAMNNQTDYDHQYISNPDSFGMNLWHTYINSVYNPGMGREIPTGWHPKDSLNADSSAYFSEVKIYIDKMAGKNMKMLMHRPKIEWLCYGQRSDYQCEEKEHVDDNLWFYSFQNSEGQSVQDHQYAGGDWVTRCSTGTTSPGIVISGLRCNNQQTKPDTNWRYDGRSNWLIKPRIRIDSAVAYDPQDPLVCKIKVISSNGSTLKDVDISANDFLVDPGDNYDGRYIEEFVNLPEPLEIYGSWGDAGAWWSRGNGSSANQADIQVYWYGNCDMWIDYIRVDNDVADKLFDPLDNYDDWLRWEAALANYSASYKAQYRFYLEELEFNNVPCVSYVNKKLQEYTSTDTVDMMVCFFWANFTNHLPYTHAVTNGYWKEGQPFDAETLHETFMEPIGLREYFTETYPFTGNDVSQSAFSKLPGTIPDASGGCVLADTISPAAYDDWLQNHLDQSGYPNPDAGSLPDVLEDQWEDPGFYSWAMKLANDYSRTYGKPFINMPQAHLFRNPNIEVRREPTNEEIMMTTNLALSYGAKGITYFWYGGFGKNDCSNAFVGKGFIDSADTSGQYPRYINAYGQNKWHALMDIHHDIKKKADNLIGFDHTQTASYIYRLSSERTQMASNTFIGSMRTYPPVEFAPDPITPDLDVLPPDTLDNVYLQAGFFTPYTQDDIGKYFMVVNRRCSPYIDSANMRNIGGRRLVAFYPNASQLPGFNNWKVINLEDSSTVWTFDKNSTSPVYLGDFMPGEGKLFKLAPVMQEGGEFVTNEYVNANVTCKDTVWNDGFNLDIPIPRVIEFKAAGKIIMEEGSFFCGYHPGNGEDDITLKGNGSDKWTGILLDGCDTVKVDNTTVQNIEDYDPPTTYYAFDIVNCSKVTISDNNFTGYNTGGVRCNYTSASGVNILITDNTFSMSNNYSPVVYVSANSSMSLPVIIDDNSFTVSSSSNSQAIVVNNIAGAVIKNNDITNYQQGILALSSSADLYNNTISSSIAGQSLSISSSTLNLTSPSKTITGGMNTINNTSVTAHNMDVSDGLFYIAGGNNTFLIPSNYSSGKHMNGYFPGTSEGSYPAEDNCFKNGTTVGAIHNVTWGSGGSGVTFNFDYNCGEGQGSGMSSKSERQTENFILVPITDEYNDTLFLLDSGVNSLHDSMFVEMRKRNYSRVAEIAETILSNEPESEYAPDAIHKLYLASLSLDSTGSMMSPLKAFLEEVILDNGDKPELIKKAFYFIQKCKSALGQYSSALLGFEDIMNNYPNTYDALIASWDYAATTLLMGGSGGAAPQQVKSYQVHKVYKELYEFYSFEDDPDGKNDRSNLSKEQKQIVKQNVALTFETERKKTIDRINVLEERSSRGDKNASHELKTIKTLQATVKKRQPESIIEHIKDVSGDIAKVFNSTDDNSIKKELNSIPVEFELSQNFPNPFNPTTKIQYALPKDGKVQLIIYDILGREMVKLVNNEFKPAGRYVSEFNGSRLASGIYFYRIIVNDGKDFNSVKKMVLIK